MLRKCNVVLNSIDNYAHGGRHCTVHVGCIGSSPKGNARLHDLIVEAYMPDPENLKNKPTSFGDGTANGTIPSPHKSAGFYLVS